MDMMILFGVFTLLMLIGTPIAFCLGVASASRRCFIWGCRRWSMFQRLNSGMSVFSLLAIPVLHLCRRPDGARRDRAEDRGLRGVAGRAHPGRARAGEHRHGNAVRRHFGLGRGGSGRGGRA
jgi:hypothetical protein